MGNHPMNAPIPTDPQRTDAASGDRSPQPDPEPIHSVAFRSKPAGIERPSDAPPRQSRFWALAAVFIGMLVAGGFLLHHLRQHPILPPSVAPVHQQESKPPVQAEKAAEPPKDATRTSPSPAPPSVAATPPSAPAPSQATGPPAPPRTEEDAHPAVDTIEETAQTTGVGSDAVAPKPDPNPAHDLLSQGLVQLHHGQYRQARDTLRQAAAREPDSEAIQEALSQAEHALKLDQLDRLQEQATAAQRQGEWSAALKHYETALAIDPNVSFALRGKHAVVQRITLTKRINFYLAQPDALFSKRHLTNAVQLLAEAESIEPKDHTFTALLNRLETAVTAAQTPLPVTITSDGQTDVAVYRVGRLGRFENRRLELQPGTYTVVGTRDGYRDVRLRLAVKPGTAPPAIQVICKEALQ